MTRAKDADRISPSKLSEVAPTPSAGFRPAEGGRSYEPRLVEPDGKRRDLDESVKWDEV
jgi:hypothetical protein